MLFINEYLKDGISVLLGGFTCFFRVLKLEALKRIA